MVDFNKEKSKNIFNCGQVENILNYIRLRNIQNKQYEKFLIDYGYGFIDENELTINNEIYSIECFLGVSNNNAYDIVMANKLAELDQTKYCAIANLYGGDLICINNQDDKIYLWTHEEWYNEPICIANDFNELLEKISN